MKFPPLFVCNYTSPIWKLTLWVYKDTLCLLSFDMEKRKNKEIEEILSHLKTETVFENHPVFDETIRQLDEYFAGKRKKFDIPLFTFGTDFQKKSWNALKTIPYGTTWSYKQEAEKIGNPKAVRAVGSANGKNRIGIIIPCHRVIGNDGGLWGFGGGLEAKEWLLNHEKITASA